MKKFTTESANRCRRQFPSLGRRENDQTVIFFDGPGGTQVPHVVVDAMSEYLLGCNANHGGLFATSRQSDRWLHEAHQAAADFVGATDADEIAFGQNMTSLTFALSRSIAKSWQPGDEIIVTELDHDANISPWVMAAGDAGATIRRVPFNHNDYTLDLEKLESLLSKKTRLVAVGCASNATGGINPVEKICAMAHEVGALVFLDAVHYGPHGLIDVQQWDCDFLACSPYKFFGPHLGLLWGRRCLLESFEAHRVRPAGDKLPGKWMTGTQSHESIVGTLACIDYLADIGRALDPNVAGQDRRDALTTAFAGIGEYERELSRMLIDGLSQIPGIKIYGITDTARLHDRFPTVSITHERIPTTMFTKQLANKGIYVWNGHYYALEFSERLGLEPEGMVRIGLVHYNTPEEIVRLLNVVGESAMTVAG